MVYWALSALRLLLLTTFLVPRQLHQIRIAIAMDGKTWDFGLTFNNNLARITLIETLLERHPGLNLSHSFAFLPDSFSEECDPQFEAWCQGGVDLLISTAVGQQWCVARLARQYPNINFLATAGHITGPPNYANIWVRFYQPAYLAGYTAGLMTQTRKICISTTMPVPVAALDISGFCRGIHAADPSVEIHIFSTGSWRYPLLEVWIVNQSHALGCDVVWVQSLAIDGTLQADQLGLKSIGFFSDARQTVGESVITSVILNMAPAYLRAAEALLNGTLHVETQKADWWMGWNWGAMRLGDFSFEVPADVKAKVMAQVPMLDRIFCGRVCTMTQCLCNSSSCCLTDAQLYSFDSYPDFTHYHGTVQLPGLACQAGQLATWHLDTFTMQCSDCPAGTYAFNVDQISECRPCPAATYSPSGATNCTACPAGTYSNRPGSSQCMPCSTGSISPEVGALRCSACPSGLSSSDGTQCEALSMQWVAGVSGGSGGALLVVSLLLLWLFRSHGKRNNQAAPKDASQPFCILFTDIQGSTYLWATIPDIMAGALDTHHRLIRRLIARHQCYEVKTIGDSFMCATKCPNQALRFALALQEKFVDHDWGTDRIDQVYGEMEPSLNSPSGGCWNGLRVRVGIHFGHGNIKLDPVSHGYDYYGTVVNTAARIESVCHGGQIGVSEAVYSALGGQFPGSVWSDLGLQPLRGLAEPLRLYHVLPVGLLSQRVFPPLRIDRMDEKAEALRTEANGFTSTLLKHCRNLSSNSVSIAPSTKCSELAIGKWVDTHPLVVRGYITVEDLRRHYHILHIGLSTLLSPMGITIKHQVVRQLCAHLHVPNHGVGISQLPYTLQGLINRVLPATVYNRSGRRGSETASYNIPSPQFASPKSIGSYDLPEPATQSSCPMSP